MATRTPSKGRTLKDRSSGFVATLQRHVAAHRLGPPLRDGWGGVGLSTQPPKSAVGGPLIPALPEVVACTPWVTVVLDLDETLCNNRRLFKAVLRPGVIEMLEAFRLERERWEAQQRGEGDPSEPRACYIEVVLWTASMVCAARPVLRMLDPSNNRFNHHIFRDGRWWSETAPCIKNLRRLGRELSHVIIVENSPLSVSHNRNQSILVKDFIGAGAVRDPTLSVVCRIVLDWAAAVSRTAVDGHTAAALPEGSSAATFLAAHSMMNGKTNEVIVGQTVADATPRRILLLPVTGGANRRLGTAIPTRRPSLLHHP